MAVMLFSAPTFAGDWTVKDGETPEIYYKGKLTTKVHRDARHKPALHPLIGPDGINMVRNYPLMEKAPGEAADHPHHTGLYFAHGKVNGVDYWHKATTTTETLKVTADDNGVTIDSTHNWMSMDAKSTVCKDTRQIRITGDDNQLVVDYKLSVTTTSQVKFGDTKEGTFAIRTHPALKGKAGATMVNSRGGTGKGIWGKEAEWVCYHNKVGGDQVYGVTIMNHPKSFRFPTTWHARDYGLLAANPFGLSYFKKQKKGAGDHILKPGESLDFHYRVIVHKGNEKTAKIAEQFTEWTK
jgi:hypothetical protein